MLNSFPIDRAYVGVAFSHNPWASDRDDDSLAYRLVFPLQDEEQEVPSYESPNDGDFYSNFATGNEERTGFPTFSMDPFTGDLVWDAPGDFLQNTQGDFSEFVVAFIVEEWRRISGVWTLIGYITRDMQIIVTPQITGRPNFDIPNQYLIAPETTLYQTIEFSDPDDDPIEVTFFGSVLELDTSPMTIDPQVSGFSSSPLSMALEWQPQNEHVRERPYLVHMKVTDDPAGTGQLEAVTYKTWVLSFSAYMIPSAPEIAMPPGKDLITGLDYGAAAFDLAIYPNPVQDILYWKTPMGGNQPIDGISVVNALGQRTKLAYRASSNISGIPVSELSSGLYLIRLKRAGAIYRSKFVKN